MKAATEEEMIGGYRVHPAASVFPLIEGDEFDDLCESIRNHGVQHAAVVRGDELIDGRNRMRAVERLRADGWSGNCPVTEWVDDGRNVAEWIWETNAIRRHMTEDGLVYASAAIWPLIAKENEARREASKFTKGAAPGPGRGKTVRTKSDEPFNRDTKAENSRSTVGQVAAKAKTSQHKARQAIAVQKAVAAGELPADTAKDLMAGKKKLRDVAPKKPRATKPKPARTMKAILEDLRDLIAEWKNADHNVEVLRDELATHLERM
jgi:ParB-like chromosome segregation protein Spo0J